MIGRRFRGWKRLAGWLLLYLVAGLVLVACSDLPTPTSDPSIITPPAGLQPTVAPPFQAATNITPEPTSTAAPTGQATTTPTVVPNTPIVKPTPAVPLEATLDSNDLGTSTWSDTEVSWSPIGDIFMLHVLRGDGSDGDFYYLIRPPDSIQASYKLPRSAFGSFDWSADGKYLVYIEKEGDNTAGIVKLIDLTGDPSQTRKLSAGACTTANWLTGDKIVAACGPAIYQYDPQSATPDTPDTLFKLDNNRFPGTDVDLSLLFQALPSPDGQSLAIYGVRRQKGPIPVGDIAFYNLASKKLDLLDRNNRPVTMVDWTPDGKYLILRNLTGDWSVPYTFDYYLADPATLKITRNLTKSNDKCDPVLGPKPECQGQQPAPVQSSRILFSPDGSSYFFGSQRWIAKPGASLTTSERLTLAKLDTKAKPDQLSETGSGEKVVGLSWLPNGHYFYSIGTGTGVAKAVLDGKTLEVKGGKVIEGAKLTPVPTTKKPGSALGGFGTLEQATSPASTTAKATPANTPAAAPATTQPPTLQINPTEATTSQAATTQPPAPTTQPPAATATSAPRGTSLLGFETVTAQASQPTPIIIPTPKPTPTAGPSVSPTPKPSEVKPYAYYVSPAGNWLIAVERVGTADKPVQFQLRLIPFSLK